MTTYEKIKCIRSLILRKCMEGYVYKEHWSVDYRIKELDRLEEIVKGWSEENEDFSIDPSDLTEQEMDDVGFGRWDINNPMRLIPLWLYPFLKDEFFTGCIDGQYSKLKKSEMDTDHRFGCLAYGVLPKDMLNKEKVTKEVCEEYILEEKESL